MSQEGPVLSELMVRYPFGRQSKEFFDRLPIEESFSSKEVLKQAENRLLSSLGRARYEPHLSELIEFSSFFVVALVASQDSFIDQKFAEKEGERAKRLFVNERYEEKPFIIDQCLGLRLEVGTRGQPYVTRMEEYLQFTTRLGLSKLQKWQLVNQALSAGLVYFTENKLNDLFGVAVEGVVYEGVKKLRRASFPKQLTELRDSVLPYVPPPKAKSNKGYLYVEELIKCPVSDGRHRLTWLVLAPYLVNVKRVDEGEAVEIIRNFVAGAGETRSMKRFIEYNVKRSKRNGLLPPTLGTLKRQHPDLYSLLPKEVIEKFTVGR